MNFTIGNQNINKKKLTKLRICKFWNENAKNLNKQLFFDAQNNLFYQIKKTNLKTRTKIIRKKNSFNYKN